MLAVLCTLVLVEPTLTVSAPANTYTTPQLVFVAISSLALWLVFIFIQTIRHRDYFLPSIAGERGAARGAAELRETWTSFAFLLISLIGVVGLAKALSPSIERAVIAAQRARRNRGNRDRDDRAVAGDRRRVAGGARQPIAIDRTSRSARRWPASV